MPWVYEDKVINIKNLSWNPMIDSIKFRGKFHGNDVDGIEHYVKVLMTSIKRFGLLKPLIVKPKADGKYGVSSGNHRAEALKRLGKKMIPCRIQK